MGTSFSSQGSTAGNPTAGLLGNMSVYKPQATGQVTGVLAPKQTTSGSLPTGPKLATNPFGSPTSGLIGSINKATGLSSGSSTPDYSPSNGYGTTPGLLPSTPVKKITTSNTDGFSTTHEFHAPETTTAENKEVSTVADAFKQQQSSTAPAAQSQTPATTTQNTGPYTPPNQGLNGVNQGGIIGNLTNFGNTESPEVTKARSELKSLQDDYAKQVAANSGSPIPLSDQVGRASIYATQYGQRLSAAQTALQNALTAQSQKIGALSSAGQLNAPIAGATFALSPSSGNFAGGENSQSAGFMQNALQTAYNMVKSGQTDLATALSTSGLAAFGDLGKTALQQALNAQGGTFSPTTNATEVGANQNNLADTTKQAFNLNQNLQQVDKISPVLTSFLQTSGVNPFDAQMYNGPVFDYLKQIGNSGAATQWAAQMGELKNFTSQILATGYGGTPTGTEKATLDQDPSKLSYSSLQSYLQTLKDLGSNRLSTLQENIKSLGGSGVGYTGAPASTVDSTAPAAAGKNEVGSGITSPLGMLTAGLALDKIPEVAQFAGDVTKNAAKGLFY